MAADDPGDDVGEIGGRLDTVELCGFEERGDDGPMLRAAVGAGEERILPGQGERPDRALDGVGVDFDAAVSEEEAQALSTRERIADGLGELRLLADQAELLAQPWLHGLEDRRALFRARYPTCIGIMATDRGFDAIELGDALEGDNAHPRARLEALRHDRALSSADQSRRRPAPQTA